MNTNDLYTLLAAPPVSRTLFFSRLLAWPRPRPQAEPLADEQPTTTAADNKPAELPPIQPTPINRPA